MVITNGAGFMSKQIESKQAARRAFLKKAGTAAAAVPAATVLLSIAEKSAVARAQSGGIEELPVPR